ncbi:E3 ubiquitin-protein ligase RNF213-like isoform X2 [Ruditapes philippinarum]|nr:E3 ubiquitin-protein ligase RNF213-like isoform X2 [Ruditapes philippinarum]
MADVKTRIMDPVKERLDKLAYNIRTGNITINEMEHLFGIQFGRNYNALEREMYIICPEEKEIKERIEQLQQFRSHEDITKVIQVLLALKNGYQLTGNFDILQRLQNHEFDNIAMNEYDNPWSEIGKLFARVTSEHVSCIQVFVNCVELVKWLRVSMKKSTLKEFIVFVDLAMISAGDKVEDIAKVQSLHAGVIGYSSLIFDLKDTDDYDEVVRKCKVVWECLKENPKIPDKLKHANNTLRWFKTIQKRHGDVEMQAKTIIESGVFTIGKHTTGADNKNIITDLTDVIKLTIPANNTYESTGYNFQQLEDLQSKLMLVAGEAREGHESVDRFTAIIEGVIRLSEVYIRLVSSGCVLFENFAIETFCEPNLETPVWAILQFKNKTDVTQLKCRKTADEKLEDIMPKLSEGMEICLKEWIEFVDEKRKKHEHLNYFTMNQLVFLQKEIANLIVNATISDNVFPLLAYVKAGCNKDDIDEAYQCVTKEMETNDLKNNEKQNSNTKESDETKNKDKSVFISRLREIGFTGKIIQRALKRFPEYNIHDAILWCMKLSLKENEDIAEESDEVWTVAQYIESAIVDDSDFDDFDKMLQKFKGVWNKFIESVESNLKDYISLHKLGTLLRLLGLKGETNFQRQMPAVYKENQPNLVICPTGQVLRTTMSVYIESEEINFPNADEVLMCTSQTSLEEVDIFLRRAVFFSRGKIHCLVEADKLEFVVCEGLQANLLEYIRNVENKTYRLVIICGSENEHTSSLISSLEKYRTERMNFDTSDVSKVISRNLKDKSGTDLAAAAVPVDYEKSNVRFVRSWRSGDGKTLYKKRRERELQEKMNSKEVLSLSIPLHERQVCGDNVVGRLLDQTQKPGYNKPRLFHNDVTNDLLAACTLITLFI